MAHTLVLTNKRLDCPNEAGVKMLHYNAGTQAIAPESISKKLLKLSHLNIFIYTYYNRTVFSNWNPMTESEFF